MEMRMLSCTQGTGRNSNSYDRKREMNRGAGAKLQKDERDVLEAPLQNKLI
jgi:hypothetical protein